MMAEETDSLFQAILPVAVKRGSWKGHPCPVPDVIRPAFILLPRILPHSSALNDGF